MSARFTATMTMGRPGLMTRLWYRRLGLPLPLAQGTSYPSRIPDLVRLLPYRWRRIHRAYADRAGFFWLPCTLCDRPYGGHEAGTTIPDPTRGPGSGILICSQCTRERTNLGQ